MKVYAVMSSRHREIIALSPWLDDAERKRDEYADDMADRHLGEEMFTQGKRFPGRKDDRWKELRRREHARLSIEEHEMPFDEAGWYLDTIHPDREASDA